MRYPPAVSDLALAALRIGVHITGGGVWLGAMVFSIFVLHPRAERFFDRAVDFEDLLFTVVHGARWKVLCGALAIVLSGVALLLITPSPGPLWTGLVVAKVLLLALVLALFVYVSWFLWPRRVFATEAELPNIRARFHRIGVLMIAANALNIGLGVGARVLRGAI